MAHVFVSYSRRNKEFVDDIVAQLEAAGLHIWIDREDIKAGKSWRVQIVEAIDTCDAFVLMLSSHSALSENVQKEIDLAQDSGRKTFVLMLEKIRLPAEIKYQLAGQQFIDVEEIGLEESIKRLIDVLKEHVASLKAEDKSKRQAELVIEGVDIKSFDEAKQTQLLDFVAQLANADPSKLKIANLTSGSVHVYIDMPSQTAYHLKTLALNSDKRFNPMGITALKLDGDAKYILTSLGIFAATVKAGTSATKGIVIGKVIGGLITAAVLIGLGLSIPTVIVPTFFPSPTSTPTNTFTPTSTSTPTATFTSTATPSQTFTPIPTLTFTPSFTPTLDRNPNAFLEFIDGNTSELKTCKGNYFAINVKDPEGVVRVIMQFHVGTKEPSNRDFQGPDAVLVLSNEKESLWGGIFNDNISRPKNYTYWRFVAYDSNGITTVLYIPGVFRYFSNDLTCGVIPQ